MKVMHDENNANEWHSQFLIRDLTHWLPHDLSDKTFPGYSRLL